MEEKKQDLKRIWIYLGITFGLTWGYCFLVLYTIIHGESLSGVPSMLAQLMTAACMFFPAIGVLLTRLVTREGFKNAWVNRLMSLASIGVLVACMVVIGLAILISENVTLALGRLEQQNVVMVYMKDYSWALYGDKVTETTSSENTSSEQISSQDETSSDNSSEGTSGNDTDKADENGIRPSDYIIHDETEAQALCDTIASLANVEKVEFISSREGLETVTSTMLEGQQEYFSFLNDRRQSYSSRKRTNNLKSCP